MTSKLTHPSNKVTSVSDNGDLKKNLIVFFQIGTT